VLQESLVGVPDDNRHHTITAPMIGTYYDTPAPGEPPFVSVGEHVDEGQTIGIIEAMKIMNEIAADRAGTVVALLATSGVTVEYGSPLVQLEPDA
jgi:acetyl-CoA carboxylase biotin carboxyl carrier protein